MALAIARYATASVQSQQITGNGLGTDVLRPLLCLKQRPREQGTKGTRKQETRSEKPEIGKRG